MQFEMVTGFLMPLQDLGMGYMPQSALKKELLFSEEIASQPCPFGLPRMDSLEIEFIENFIKIWVGNYLPLSFKKKVFHVKDLWD